MKYINKAYDILRNPQKKQIYDNGNDPETGLKIQDNYNSFKLLSPIKFFFMYTLFFIIQKLVLIDREFKILKIKVSMANYLSTSIRRK